MPVPESSEKQRFTFRIASFANEESRERAGEHLAGIFPHRAPGEITRALARAPLSFSVTATPERAVRLAESLADLGAALSAEPDPRARLAASAQPEGEPLPLPLEPIPDGAIRAGGAEEPETEAFEAMLARLSRSKAPPAAKVEAEGPPAFFWYAWVDTLFSPQRLFASLRAPGGTFRALLFAATLGFLAAVLAFPAQALNAMNRGTLDAGSLADRYLVTIFTQPLATVTGTILSAALVHLGLRLFSGPRPFEITLKVLSYATAAAVFAAIPGGGPSIATLIGIVLSVVGLTVAHRVRPGQAIGAIFFPALLVGGLLLLLAGAFLLGGLALLQGLST